MHGYGDQKFLRKSYHEDRIKGLKDRTRYSDSQLKDWGIKDNQGWGRTDPSIFEIWQFPFPIDTTIRSRQKVNVSRVHPEIGEQSD